MKKIELLHRLIMIFTMYYCIQIGYAEEKNNTVNSARNVSIYASSGVLEKSDTRDIQTPIAGGNVILGMGTQMVLSPGVVVSITGNFSNEGTFTAAIPTTVIFNGTLDQLLNGKTIFDNLSKSGNGTLTLTSPITVNHALNILSGHINTGSASISFGPDGKLNGEDVGGQIIGPDSVLSPQVVTLTQSVNDGWNMVSAPVNLEDYSKISVYPTSVSQAFSYKGSYQPRDTLRNGEGFWVKFDRGQTVDYMGTLILNESFDVGPGWNIIGSISIPVAVSSIISNPGGVEVSSFFGYDGLYNTADTIYPGRAYWVRVSETCKLILSSLSANNLVNRIHIVPTSERPPAAPGEDILNTSMETPGSFALEQNYPNPFNPITAIKYQLPVESRVTLKIYNMLGQEMATLVDGMQEAGFKYVEFDASALPSGIYACKLTAGEFTETKRMLLIK